MSDKSSDYWTERSSDYLDITYKSRKRGGNVDRLKIVLEMLAAMKPGKLLDIGCGPGFAINKLRGMGWDARGVDYSDGMIDIANRQLADNGHPNNLVQKATADDLHIFHDKQFDVVTSMGVFPYIEDDAAAYKEVHRIIKEGGVFISSHQNEIFDIFTANRYTIDFYKRNFAPILTPECGTEDEIMRKYTTLFSFPDEPAIHGDTSARDKVFHKSENPLTYHEKVESNGFVVDAPLEYYSLHFAPPLIERNNDAFSKFNDEKGFEFRRDWRCIIMGAHFVVKLKKQTK